MKRILVTTDFCKGSQKLVTDNKSRELHDLRTVLILLVNGEPIPKKYRDHQLQDREFRELHISGDTLLIYKNETDTDTLIVSLKLANISNHKSLNHDAGRKDYKYNEVSTQDLHDITSSIKFPLSDFEGEVLYDFLESLSDYASMQLNHGYVLLSDYRFDGQDLHCDYDYISYDTNNITDSIDFIISCNQLNRIIDIERYLHEFATEISKAFE